MPADDMPGLVRQHPDQLIRRLRLFDQAGIEEDRLSAGDKRVQLVVGSEVDFHIGGIETGGAPDRGSERADIVFDLGVADDVQTTSAAALRPDRRRKADERHECRGHNGGSPQPGR